MWFVVLMESCIGCMRRPDLYLLLENILLHHSIIVDRSFKRFRLDLSIPVTANQQISPPMVLADLKVETHNYRSMLRQYTKDPSIVVRLLW